MRIDVLTIFPEYFSSPFSLSLLKRAADAGIVQLAAHDLRDFTTNKHRQVDDTPYGGGPGMIMKPEPFFDAFESFFPEAGSAQGLPDGTKVVMLSPHGRPLDQAMCRRFAENDRLLLLCGRYEGIDARVEEHLCTDVVSIGDYVLMGGEAAALVLIEAVTRLLPGVLGCEGSTADESFSEGLLEYPQFTKPETHAGYTVPEILLSGDHGRVAEWRRRESLHRTLRLRPDLIEHAALNDEELRYLAQLEASMEQERTQEDS